MSTLSNLPTELLREIFGYTECGSQYKSYCLLSRRIYRVLRGLFPGAGIDFANHLLMLLHAYPDERWDYTALAANPNIRLEYIPYTHIKQNIGLLSINKGIPLHAIVANPHFEWNWINIYRRSDITAADLIGALSMVPDNFQAKAIHSLCCRQDLSWALIDANMHVAWDWYEISRKDFITAEIVLSTRVGWSYDWLAGNANVVAGMFMSHQQLEWSMFRVSKVIDLQTIFDNPEILWDWEEISMRQDVTWQIISANTFLPWNWYCLSRSAAVTLDVALSCPIDWYNFSANPNVTIKFVRQHLDKPFNWKTLSENLPLADICANTDLPWHWGRINLRNDITIAILETYPTLPWDWERISEDDDITYEDIFAHRYLSWDWETIEMARNQTWALARAYPDADLDWQSISSDKHLDLSIILANTLPWDWDEISANARITWADVVGHPELPWNFAKLSRNMFGKTRCTLYHNM